MCARVGSEENDEELFFCFVGGWQKGYSEIPSGFFEIPSFSPCYPHVIIRRFKKHPVCGGDFFHRPRICNTNVSVWCCCVALNLWMNKNDIREFCNVHDGGCICKFHSAWIRIGGVIEPKDLCACIHLFYKILARGRTGAGEGVCSVVRGTGKHGVKQIIYRKFVSMFYIQLRTSNIIFF